MISPLEVAKAYAATQGVGASGESGGVEAAGGSDFAKMLEGVMGDAVKASKTAETQIAAQVQGKAELIDVVTAISSAEASLETVMAVRDQVISAYQEIMRMPI